jgi:hypothetical protein
MRKSVKGLQNVLNDFFDKLSDNIDTVSKSAYCQSKHKLKYSAYMELSDSVLEEFYKTEKIATYKNHKLLSIDGSYLELPMDKDIIEKYGITKINSTSNKKEYVKARVSVMYDSFNYMPIEAMLSNKNRSEIELALEHIKKAEKNDIIIFDRGYTSYKLFNEIVKQEKYFICRTAKHKFSQIINFFESEEKDIVIELLRPEKLKIEEEKIKVRLIKVELSSGETEVLITNLIDKKKYKREEFKELYWYRWKIETYYDILKTRLNLENFTGKTLDSIEQDFYSTIFISILETIATKEINKELKEKSKENKYEQKVNRSVSFNTIKNNIIDLILRENQTDEELLEVIEKIKNQFRNSPTLNRPNRQFERKKIITWRKVNYYKKYKKYTY